MADPNMDLISHTKYKNVLNFKSMKINLDNYLKIFHVNIRSLNKNHDQLAAFLLTLSIEFDIIVLSELWILNLECYLHFLPGYSFLYQINPLNQSSGIGCFISTKLTYNYDSSIILSGSEYLQISLKSTPLHNLNNLTIHCIYRHPGPLQNEFLPNLESVIKSKPKAKQLIIGDLNINILDNICQMSYSYLNLLNENMFLPLILSPTRITQSSQTLIDHIMFNGFNEIKAYSGNIYTDISDHLANYTLIPLFSCQKFNSDRPLVRSNATTSIESFRLEISQFANLSHHYKTNTNNINDVFSNYYESFHDCFNKCFPKVKQSIKKFKLKPWINKALLKLIRRKINYISQHSNFF